MNASKVQSGQWSVDRGRGETACSRLRPRPFLFHPSNFILRRRGFTLVELMVTITIIGIVVAMSLAALQKARTFAAEEKTKATIAKLDAIIMRRYESYKTRRIPLNIPPNTPPKLVAWMKLNALRDLMRMEMPDCGWDIWDYQNNVPRGPMLLGVYPNQYMVPQPAVNKYYVSNRPWVDTTQNSFDPAQCLYLIVSANAEDLAQFSQNEIGTVGPPGSEKRVFIDGWGKPIMFVRWAPGFLPPYSEIQTGDYKKDHDPFDSRRVDDTAYKLTPLIYSGGPDGIPGIFLGDAKQGFAYPTPDKTDGHIYPCKQQGGIPLLGSPDPNSKSYFDNITNHQIEMN